MKVLRGGRTNLAWVVYSFELAYNLPGLFQTIYLISISISLKNKGENEKSCWKFGKDCALCLQHISVYMESYCQITSQPDRSWCIKLIGCIWDKWFDLENIEKSVLNFGRFYTLS